MGNRIECFRYVHKCHVDCYHHESDFGDGCDEDRITEGINETALPNLDDVKEFAASR